MHFGTPLAIVKFLNSDTHRTHYLRQPFQREPDFGVTSVNYDLAELLARGATPMKALSPPSRRQTSPGGLRLEAAPDEQAFAEVWMIEAAQDKLWRPSTPP